MKLKKYNMIGIIFLGILLFTSVSSLVSASDDDDDGVDDDFEESHKRNVEIQFEPGEIQIESTLRNGARHDQIKLKIRNESEGLSIEFGYEYDLSTENTTEVEIEFEVTFRKLIEFVDLDDDGIYNPSVDNMIQEVPLNNFQPAVYTTSTLSDDTELHYLILNSTDGVFTAHVYLAEEFDVINGTFIKPTQTKIDIEITDFNYIDGSSQLALYTKLESEIEYEEDEHTENEDDGKATEEKEVIISTTDFAGFFSWAENAMVDGISKVISASNIQVDDDDENEQKMYLNYPRGSHIYHDPIMGIMAIVPATMDIPLIIIVSIISILGIGGVVVIVILRRRRNID